MALEHFERARAELNEAIGAGLGTVLVARHDARLGDVHLALCDVTVGHQQGNLFGGSQAREEAKLIVVALGLAPIFVDRRDQRLGLLNAEGINGSAVLLSDAKTLQARCRVVLLRVVAVAILECTAQRADDVVVGLLRKLHRIGDLGQRRILHPLEDLLTDRGPPGRIENLAVAVKGRKGEVVLGHARLAVRHEFIEDLIASALARDAGDLLHETIFGEFF